MSVAANQVRRQAEGRRRSFPVAAGVHIYDGTLVYINSSGFADSVTATGANKFAGVAAAEADNSGGNNGDIQIEVFATGDFLLPGSGFAQTSVGLDAFGLDNFTVDDADGAAAVRIGSIVGYLSSSLVAVSIDTSGFSQGAALTTALTALTSTAPGTPDYAIQDLTNPGFGFVTKDEGNSVLKVVANLQTRVGELETRLKAAGLLA